MNLHAIAGPIIATVNPFQPVTINVNTGYTTASDGSRAATFSSVAANAQIQALTYQDMQFLDGLILNGERRSIYLYGVFDSVNRPAQTGGDTIVFIDGTVWLIAYVFEQWPNWCRVAATKQNV